jgi:hypothetical protein
MRSRLAGLSTYRRVVGATLLVLLAWFVVKGVPFLTKDRPAIWATPTSEAFDAAQLAPVTVPARGGRVCVDGIPWAPEAKYVQLRVLPGVKATTPPIDVVAAAPGYHATATIPAGLPQNAQALAKLTPAPREVTGSLCAINRGPRPLALYGVAKAGRLEAPVKVTIDGNPLPDRQLTVTLLSNPSQSPLARLGDIFSHIAAWRPWGAWAVWIVALLLLLGTPVALAIALGRAAEADAEAAEAEAPSAEHP